MGTIPWCSAALAVIVTLLTTDPALAAGPGTSGGVSLTFPSGARSQAMAEAYTASAHDLNGIYYNPAVISALSAREASAFYGRGLFDDSYIGLTYAQPAGRGVLGASLKYYTTGDIRLDDGESTRSVNGMSDYTLGFTYAAPLGDVLGLGGTFKLLRSTLVEDFSATAVAVDLGLTYRPAGCGLLLGAAAGNLGGGLKYRDTAAALPWALGIGAVYEGTALGSPVSAAADLTRPREGSLRTRIGFELKPGGLLAVRVGYKFGYDSDTFTAGLGVRVRRLVVNYATGIAADVDNLHLVELTYRF